LFYKQSFKNIGLIMMLFFLIPFGNIYGNSDQMKDIKGHKAEADIQEWLDKGLITGYPDQTFRPDNVISRGEFVALVNRVFKYSDKSTISFKDLKQTNWVYIDVQKAIAQGYINGFEDNTFRPNKQITRQETAVILSKILKFNDKDVLNLIPPKDSNLIPSWSKTAIHNILDKGIMSNYSDGTFQPQRQMTRAESVVAIKKALTSSTVIYNKPGVFGDTALNTIHSDVIIQSSDVTLKNMHILGDLIFSKEIGDGNSYIEQVQVDGVTRIEGGGSNSIHIKNSQLGTVFVNKPESAVRVVAEGSTRVQLTQILSSAIIEEQNVSGEGFVNLYVLPETKETKSRNISIAGDFNDINVNANLHAFTVRSGTINSLFIKEKLIIPSIVLNKGVTVQTLELRSTSTISGDGQISKVILSDDAKDSVLPDVKKPAIPLPGGGGGDLPGGGGVSPEPETPTLSVASIVAANGSIEVLFNKSLTAAPNASEFIVSRKINNGAFQKVDISLTNLLENKTTVKLTIPSVGSSDQDQVVVYSLSYKNANAVLAQAFTVAKSNAIVKGSLYYLKYNGTKPLPIIEMLIHLKGVNETTGTYKSITNKSGSFTFNNVQSGTYVINIYVGLTKYYTDEFTVEAGQMLEIPDIIIEEDTPLPSVEKTTFSDIGYLSGSVQYLKETFSVKVELENGTVLKTGQIKFNNTFGLNLFEYNPGLVLNGNDKLFVTLYTDGGWKSERFIVNVVERPKTKSPNVTSVVYDDTKYIKGTLEDWSNRITVTRMDDTLIGQFYNHLGNDFSVYLFEGSLLTAGEKIKVYAQADGKRKSDPTYITVIAPTVVTNPPKIEGIIYEDALYLAGTAEAKSFVVVKRSDGTVIGEGQTSEEYYGSKFSIRLSTPPIAGETLYLSAKGYEKIISELASVVVENRPITATPKIVGEVFSDFTYIHATVIPSPQVRLYLKEMNGKIISEGYLLPEGSMTFWNLDLIPNAQYQLTAIAPEMKESAPFIFTAVAPTEITSVPIITVPIYADADYKISGITDPYATVYLYYEDGSLYYSIPANDIGEFTFVLPTYPPLLPGAKLIVRADARGKLISEELVLTTTAPIEKSSPPVINNQIYGYTNELKGTAATSALIKLFHEDGRQINTGSYTDMNTGRWTIGLVYTVLRGGDRIYVITDEPGKLPSDPYYITIQSAPKSNVPVVTSTVNAQSLNIQGTYDGMAMVNHILTTILLVNENNEVIGVDWVKSDGTFSLDIRSNHLVAGQMIRIIAKEGQKEASDPLFITVN